MQDKPSPFDAGRAWTDAMALLNGQREILLTLTGFFIMLPALLLNALRPFVPSGKSETWVAEIAAWTEANFVWIILVAVLAALGRLAMLILLLGPERPTVGEALVAGAKLLLMFVLMDILIGLMLLHALNLASLRRDDLGRRARLIEGLLRFEQFRLLKAVGRKDRDLLSVEFRSHDRLLVNAGDAVKSD